MKILIVEDDKKLSAHLVKILKDQQYLVDLANSIESLENYIQSDIQFNLLLLDRLIETSDIKNLIPKIRRKWSNIPIIVMSAINTPNERTETINMGADDYLGKPFSTEELSARIRSLLRRAATPTSNYLQISNLVINIAKRTVSVNDTTIVLPSKEYQLLHTLCKDPGRVWTKDQILDYVWGQSFLAETNVVESTFANIRKKLKDMDANIQIKNMRNTGYWIET